MTKQLTHLLKSLEITLHSLHEEVREHNKDYFSDNGQEYPVPTVSAERQKDIADKIRSDLKKLTTEEKLQKEKKVALVMMKFRGQLKDLPDGSATFDKRVLKKTIKNIRRIT